LHTAKKGGGCLPCLVCRRHYRIRRSPAHAYRAAARSPMCR
jgi:hypothetical protein